MIDLRIVKFIKKICRAAVFNGIKPLGHEAAFPKLIIFLKY